MRIVVVGCGAMGSIYAGLLADAGNEVIAIDPWVKHVDRINSHGLRIEGASGDRTVQIKALEKSEGNTADLIVLAVKSAHAEAAIRSSLELMGENTVVLTIQNGLGAGEQISKVIGPERLAIGIAAAFGASIKGPAHAHHNSMGQIRMGAYGGLSDKRLESIVRAWKDAGFDTQFSKNIIAMQWEKLICNVAYSGPCGLTGMTVGDVMNSEILGPISINAAVEAWETARALDIGIKVEDPVAHVRAFGEKVAKAKPSLLLDIEAGRKSEIDFINGAIPREAAKIGKHAPVNATLTGLIQQLEQQRQNSD